ncbi:MAG TPA: glycosyltransferase family 4 protein [Polyangiales bacterium]|nr:glycosyltransferase family 4 protein [Polyangiales bacterium]
MLSFEGPDPYARAGGLASRVTGLSQQLAALGHDTDLWFVGNPEAPGHERVDGVQLHRWCQWLSALHPRGVYDGELAKEADYAKSLPTFLLPSILGDLRKRREVVVLAEEWHTVPCVLHLDALLRERGLRSRVRILWNANNTFGFERIDWPALARAATITTVSRYMKHAMRPCGVDAIVLPNGLEPSAYLDVDSGLERAFSERVAGRLLLTKVARFDPDKRWLGTIDVVAALKRRKQRPLLVARGGMEAHGHDVLARARAHGLVISDRTLQPGPEGLIAALSDTRGVDIVHLTSHLDTEARRLLFRGSVSVLANSTHEPFGLVGLEAMAAGGVACTGSSGEDYAVPNQNAIVLQTAAPEEAVTKLERLQLHPDQARALRREGVVTARNYAWRSVIERDLIPQLEIVA